MKGYETIEPYSVSLLLIQSVVSVVLVSFAFLVVSVLLVLLEGTTALYSKEAFYFGSLMVIALSIISWIGQSKIMLKRE